MRPVYPVEAVAERIVQLAERPRGEMFVGAAARMIAWQHALAPRLTERMMARKLDRDHLQDVPAEPTPGNLLEPMPEWASPSGNWLPPQSNHSAAPAAVGPAAAGRGGARGRVGLC